MHAHRRPGADREWETRKKKTRVENLPTRESQDRKEGRKEGRKEDWKTGRLEDWKTGRLEARAARWLRSGVVAFAS